MKLKEFLLAFTFFFPFIAFAQLDLSKLSFIPLDKIPGEQNIDETEKYKLLKKIVINSKDTLLDLVFQTYDCLHEIKKSEKYTDWNIYESIHFKDLNNDGIKDCIIDPNSWSCGLMNIRIYLSRSENNYSFHSFDMGSITKSNPEFTEFQTKVYACCEFAFHQINSFEINSNDTILKSSLIYQRDTDSFFVNHLNYPLKSGKLRKTPFSLYERPFEKKPGVLYPTLGTYESLSENLQIIYEKEDFYLVIVQVKFVDFGYQTNFKPEKYFLSGWIKKEDLE